MGPAQYIRYLLRAKRLAQNPPPMWKVKLVIGIVLVCAALFLVERYIGWPDALGRSGGGLRINP